MNIRVIATTAGLYAAASGCTTSVSLPQVQSGVAISEQCPDSRAVSLRPDATGAPGDVAAGLAAEIDRFVSAAGQKPLWCGDSTAEGYRVLWIPAYGAVRLAALTKTSSGWRTDGVEYADPRGRPPAPLPPQEISTRTDAIPSATRVAAFLSAVEAADYWTAPGWRESKETMDGAMWTLEGRRGNRYRIVSRSNFHDPALDRLVQQLFEIANVATPERLVHPGLP